MYVVSEKRTYTGKEEKTNKGVRRKTDLWTYTVCMRIKKQTESGKMEMEVRRQQEGHAANRNRLQSTVCKRSINYFLEVLHVALFNINKSLSYFGVSWYIYCKPMTPCLNRTLACIYGIGCSCVPPLYVFI